MRLTILGSGTGVPLPEHQPPGYWVQSLGCQLLMDCGSGSVWRLTALGGSLVTLDGVAISHTHPDHCGDLLTLLHALHLPGMQRDKPLYLFGPTGFAAFLEQFIFQQTKKPKGFALVVQENPQAVRLGDLSLSSAPMQHSTSTAAIGYRVTSQGGTLVYSGDAEPSAALIGLSDAADLAVFDCSTLAQGQVAGHMSALQCGEVAQQAGVKRLILSHLYPLAQGRPNRDRLAECRLAYAGEVVLASDRAHFTV
ncbi:beta-lactamase domain protein [Magnetococcus marinus MC-1]|uniref:Beta-lactamase domain protein n=1 Tax=Magnetococcus marinus (strain ATCC BAA-1437 / JCM 17883 / MC-1) TaxID=156889 RepID=A0L666_MAGMM|nr:MBL fold metallo-hydrolase [Magnetococcus marinus]ABK43459.1 beta-lactamase domain protein [Magnetococcus marinus MC-1]